MVISARDLSYSLKHCDNCAKVLAHAFLMPREKCRQIQGNKKLPLSGYKGKDLMELMVNMSWKLFLFLLLYEFLFVLLKISAA